MHRNQKFIYNMAFVVLQSAHSLKGVSQFTMIMWPLTPETSLVAYSRKWTEVLQNCSLLLQLYSPLVPTLSCHCKDFQVALGLVEPEIVKYEHQKKEQASRLDIEETLLRILLNADDYVKISKLYLIFNNLC